MAKYLGIPLTVSNGNKTPLTAQPNKVENPTFEGTQTASGVNFILSSGWRLNNSGVGAAASSSEFTSEGAKIEWPAANPASSTFLRAWNVGSASNKVVFTVGKGYKMTYTISSSSNDLGLRLENGASILSLNTSVGTHELDFVADIDTFTIIRNSTLNSGATIVISSIYVKEIAATETPTYGSPELIKNGDFEDGTTDWTASAAGSTFTVGTHQGRSNVADIGITDTDVTSRVTQSFDFVKGKAYSFSIDVYLVSGSFRADTIAAVYAPDFASTTKTGVWQTLTVKFVADSTQTADIFLRSLNEVSQFYVDSVSIKEVPYVMGTQNFFPTPLNASDYGGEGEKSILGNRIFIKNDGSVNPYSQFQYLNLLEDDKLYTVTFDLTVGEGSYSIHYTTEGIVSLPGTGTYTFNLYGSSTFYIGCNFSGDTTWSLSNIVINEAEYNYLQVADGGFKKSVKEGDVIFNTSTSTEGVVKQVLDNNVLLMSNDNFSTAGEFFNVFAANGDTRGNQVVRTDNYIMSEYDENASDPQETSFWFAGGVNADKVALTQLNPATNTFFVAGVIEEYLERLNAQSATASRLDIPLDAFRDHKYNEVLTTTAITLS